MVKYLKLTFCLLSFSSLKASEEGPSYIDYEENIYGSMVPYNLLTKADVEREKEYEMTSSDSFLRQEIKYEDQLNFPPLPESLPQDPLLSFDRLPIEEVHLPPMGLSIDGGGIRGLMPALILERLSDELERRNLPPIQKVFDVFGGTSVGGLIALGLADGKSPEELIPIFNENGKTIFSGKGIPYIPRKINGLLDGPRNLVFVKYGNQGLESLTKSEGFFGSKKMHELSKDVLVTACGIDGSPHILKSHPFSYHEHDAQYNMSKDIPIWKAALSTSAAPTFFPSVKVLLGEFGDKDLVDGGVWCNNPSFLVATHLSKKFQAPLHQIHILSLGTGKTTIDRWLSRSSGRITMAGPVIQALMASQSLGADITMKTLLGHNYTRINPQLDHPIELDSTSKKSLEILKETARDKLKSCV